MTKINQTKFWVAVLALLLMACGSDANRGFVDKKILDRNSDEIDRGLASDSEPTKLQILLSDVDHLELQIINPVNLDDDELYVLEASQDLADWQPYKIFVNTHILHVPRRYTSEFFRLVIRKIPAISAGGNLQVINYSPEQIIDRGPDEDPLIIPEQGTFFIVGSIGLVDPNELNVFPDIRAHSPQVAGAHLAPFEIGIRGLSAGHLVYDYHTQFSWRSPDFDSYQAALDFLNQTNELKFIVPRAFD
jgi:hypothetical protein